VNRRENLEADVEKLVCEGKLKGPVDPSVPVLIVRNLVGSLVAVTFGYACHNTTFLPQNYLVSGDYAGYAQIALERNHPGATAMFFMGCGADANPMNRGSLHHVRRFGEMLAAAVEEALLLPPKKLKASLELRHEFVELSYSANPTKEELEACAVVPADGKRIAKNNWADRLLNQLKEGKTFAKSYPVPIQVWRLGYEQLWIALGFEVVVDYSIRFKLEFGDKTWVSAYANDHGGYIPSNRVLMEDKGSAPLPYGYEGNRSFYFFSHPAHRWADDAEFVLAACVRKMAKSISDKS
jgi:hypothetical protein